MLWQHKELKRLDEAPPPLDIHNANLEQEASHKLDSSCRWVRRTTCRGEEQRDTQTRDWREGDEKQRCHATEQLQSVSFSSYAERRALNHRSIGVLWLLQNEVVEDVDVLF